MGVKENDLKIKIIEEQYKNIVSEEKTNIENQLKKKRNEYESQYQKNSSDTTYLLEKEINQTLTNTPNNVVFEDVKRTFIDKDFAKSYVYKNSFLRELDNLKNFGELNVSIKNSYFNNIESEAQKNIKKYNLDLKLFYRLSLMGYYNNLSQLYQDIFKTKTPSNYLKNILKLNFNNLKEFFSDKLNEDNIFQTILASLSSFVTLADNYENEINYYNINSKKLELASNNCLESLQKEYLPQLEIDNIIIDNYEKGNIFDELSEIDYGKICIQNTPNGFLNLNNVNCNVIENGLKYKEITNDLNNPIDNINNNDVLIRNLTNYYFNILVKDSEQVNSGSILAIINNNQIISPVDGKIKKVSDNEIYITDVFAKENDTIYNFNEQTNDKIKKNFYQKEILKDLYVSVSYPLLLNSVISKTNKNDILNLVNFKNIYDNSLKRHEQIINDFNLQVQNICGVDYIKNNAENESLDNISNKLEDIYNNCLNNIYAIINDFKNAQNYKWDEKDLYLLDFYLKIYQSLFIYDDQENIYVRQLQEKISNFINQRLITDSYKSQIFSTKINDILNNLYLQNSLLEKDYFSEYINQYNINKDFSIIQKNINNFKTNNNQLTEKIINSYKEFVIILFQLYLNSLDIKNDKKETQQQLIERVESESIDIDNFFLNIRKDLTELNLNNIILETKQFGQNQIFLTNYFESVVDGVNYKIYDVTDSTNFISNNDEAVLPDYEHGPQKLQYWVKYCSVATLVGLTPNRWSTGLILPTGPVKLPVIYLALSTINTNWGNIVLGLGICGIAISPMLLYNNFDLNANSPIDLTSALKKQIKNIFEIDIKQIKDTFKTQLSNSANNILHDNLMELNINIEQIKKQKTNNIVNKPNNLNLNNLGIYQHIKNFIIEKLSFYLPPDLIDKLKQSEIPQITPNENKLIQEAYSQYEYDLNQQYSENKNNFNEISSQITAINNYIKQDIYNDSLQDNTNKQISIFEKNIEKKEEEINNLNEKIETTILLSPQALKGDSMSFGATIKKPLPVNLIKEDVLINSINLSPVNNYLNNSLKTLENNLFISDSEFDIILNESCLNPNKLLSQLKQLNSTILLKDNLPKYEKLNISNILFSNYLLSDFTNVGSKCFGLPGFSPF